MTKYASEVEAVDALAAAYQEIKKEIGKVIIGQDLVVDQVLISIFCDGHSLLVGVPGLAKTLLVKTIADALHLSFNRIQFTPDLMPSDITGSEILDKDRKFVFTQGPIFANIVLADEINRTPPKTQAALLEAMQEKAITVSGHMHSLDRPFFVLATQNPIEQEGTYPLPEAQLDRFMFNIVVEYPSFEEELQVVKNTTSIQRVQMDKILEKEDIKYFQSLIRQIPVPDNVMEYAVELTHRTRPEGDKAVAMAKEYLDWGAGPRASQYLVLGAKAHAVLHGKYSPDMEDVRAIALPILRHRVIRNYKAEAEGVTIEDIVARIL